MQYESLPPPGYYPDPEDATRRRWWDGHAWAILVPRGDRVAPPPIGSITPPTTNQFAMASLVLSISWIFFIGSVLGVVFGHLAMAQLRDPDRLETGRGSATIGLIVGYTGIAAGFLLALVLAG